MIACVCRISGRVAMGSVFFSDHRYGRLSIEGWLVKIGVTSSSGVKLVTATRYGHYPMDDALRANPTTTIVSSEIVLVFSSVIFWNPYSEVIRKQA